MNTFELVCAKCGHKIRGAGEVTAGENFRCPGCRNIIVVPGAEVTKAPQARTEAPDPRKPTFRELPPYVPKHPDRAKPKSDIKVENVEIDGRIYTMQSGSAAQTRRMIATGKYSGPGRVTPLPGGGPEAWPGAAKATSGREYLKPSATATPRQPAARKPPIPPDGPLDPDRSEETPRSQS
jgi:hypothetical protein